MTGGDAPLGILSALPEEMGSLGAALDPAGDVRIAGFHFRSGRIDGHPVIPGAYEASLASGDVGRCIK